MIWPFQVWLLWAVWTLDLKQPTWKQQCYQTLYCPVCSIATFASLTALLLFAAGFAGKKTEKGKFNRKCKFIIQLPFIQRRTAHRPDKGSFNSLCLSVSVFFSILWAMRRSKKWHSQWYHTANRGSCFEEKRDCSHCSQPVAFLRHRRV